MMMATTKVAAPSSTKLIGTLKPASFCSARKSQRARHHEGGVEHIDARHHAGAAVDTGPGLHRREGRHDEQAAGDSEDGEIDADVNAARGGEETDDAERSSAVDEIMAGPAEIDGEHTEQHGADQCRQDDDAPGRKPGGETGAERDCDREDRQEHVDEMLSAAEVGSDERKQ